MRTLFVSFAALLITALATPAQAEIITFNEIAPTEVIKTSVDSGNFHFASGHFHTYGCLCRVWANIASNGTPHIGYEADRGMPITMTALDGGLFSLFSLDAAEFSAGATDGRPNAQVLNITGLTGTGTTVSHSLYLDGFIDGLGGGLDFEHFSLPDTFQNLVAVTFTGLRLDGRDGGITLDNIEYNAVPEPGVLALFGLGLIGLTSTRRKAR